MSTAHFVSPVIMNRWFRPLSKTKPAGKFVVLVTSRYVTQVKRWRTSTDGAAREWWIITAAPAALTLPSILLVGQHLSNSKAIRQWEPGQFARDRKIDRKSHWLKKVYHLFVLLLRMREIRRITSLTGGVGRRRITEWLAASFPGRGVARVWVQLSGGRYDRDGACLEARPSTHRDRRG